MSVDLKSVSKNKVRVKVTQREQILPSISDKLGQVYLFDGNSTFHMYPLGNPPEK